MEKNINIKHLIIWLLALCSQLACNKTKSPDPDPPSIQTPTLYIGTSSQKLFAINPLTGIPKWDIVLQGPIVAPVVVDNTNAYLGDKNGNYYAINKTTGAINWQNKLQYPITTSLGLYHDTLIVASLGNSSYHFCRKDGNVFLNDSILGISSAAPVINNQKVFFCVTDHIGWFFLGPFGFCGSNYLFEDSIMHSSPYYDKEIFHTATIDGNVISKYDPCVSFQMGKISRPTHSKITGSVSVYKRMIIVGSHDGLIHSWDVNSTFENWKYKTNGKIESSPVIDPETETVFIGSDDMNLYAINFVDGTLRWKFPTASIIKSSPIIYDQYVYFASMDKYLYCVNRHTGKLFWKYNLNALCTTSAVIEDGSKVIYPAESGMDNL